MPGIAEALSRPPAPAASTTPATPGPGPGPRSGPRREDRKGAVMKVFVWALLILLIVPEGCDYPALLVEEAPTAGSAVSRALWLFMLGGGLSIIAWRSLLAWRLVVSWLNPFLLIFIAFAIASIAWSVDPGLSARRVIRLLAISLVALAFGVIGWHAWRFQETLRPLLTLVLLGSIAFGLTYPGLAIHQEVDASLAGAWRGLASHKNALGNLAGISAVLWLHAGLARQLPWRSVILGLTLALFCLTLSRSTTAMMTAVFSMLFMVMLMRPPAILQRYMPWLVTGFMAFVLMYSLVVLDLLPGVSLLRPIGVLTGKDMTFTGRTEIWEIVFDEVSQHPWLGIGYGAYWTGPIMGTPSYELIRQLQFYPGSAHNGYLDTLNDLGRIGLLLLFAYLAHFLLQSLRLLAIDRAQGALFLGLFLHQAITNLSESRWLNVQSVDFVIMTLATVALARALFEHRRQTAVAVHSSVVTDADPGFPSPAKPKLVGEGGHVVH